jgi:hypothetical protein
MVPSAFVIPLRILGWAALGFALGVGWKLGSHLVNATFGKEGLLCRTDEGQGSSSILMRKFDAISKKEQ